MFEKSYYSLDESLKKNLTQRYQVNYIKNVKAEYSSVLIECATQQEARELEGKLKEDYIKTLKLENVMVSVQPVSNKNFIHLLLYGDTAYQEAEKKQQMTEETERARLEKFAAHITKYNI